FAAREDAIAAWNRRAPPDEAAAIRAACDEYVPDAEKACFYPECACDRDGDDLRIARAVLAAIGR
ncbi:MAG: hypothetical protein KGL39_57980, partial [Patescibacteria group bacterium]|nr:hypothetical protein [Patescibacteria group bacterium]